MLSYFRINDPYRLLVLVILFIILYLPLIVDPAPLTIPVLKSVIVGQKIASGSPLYTSLIDPTAPATGWFEALLNMVFGKSINGRHILAILIIFFQAILMGVIFIHKKIYPENSFIPSLIYGLLFLYFFDTISLSGELLGLNFLLLAWNSLFKEIEFREESPEMVLKTGLFIGLGSLFSLSFIMYVPAVLIILILFTRSSGKKLFLLVAGFAIPHMLLLTVFWINGGARELWEYFYVANFTFNQITYVSGSLMLILGAIPLFFLLASLVLLTRESRFTKYQSQVLQAIFFWLIFSFVQVFFTREFLPGNFITLIPPVTFFIAHFLLMIRRKGFAEICFWILFFGLVYGNYYTRYTPEGKQQYEKLVVKDAPSDPSGKRVLVLGEGLEYYRNNTMASPFLDWKLSRTIFAEPDYYENVITVYEGLKKESPEVIIDPQNLLKPFLERIPEIRKKYTRSGERYILTAR